jgi:hypothetical protein
MWIHDGLLGSGIICITGIPGGKAGVPTALIPIEVSLDTRTQESPQNCSKQEDEITESRWEDKLGMR